MTISFTERLIQSNSIKNAPYFLGNSIHYEVIMGSQAYGVAESHSDLDLYGFFIPPKEEMFSHLRGEIPSFDANKNLYEHYQQHHIPYTDEQNNNSAHTIDVAMYSIAKYFRLLMENNPNIIDSLFVPDNCIIKKTKIADMVQTNRSLFLHKGCWAKFKGYAYSQIGRLKSKQSSGKRQHLVDKFGYDVKFAYHILRLLNEVEQLLTSGELDLQSNQEQLKSVRRGEWTLDEIERYFADKESSLNLACETSLLPDGPNVAAIKNLLINCLEEAFGDLTGIVVRKKEPHNDNLFTTF